ncbi:uncharacterized protein LOC124741097, partial [Schistocerca piceifrons]|uniref:uncharacterized protein LOC124741097 n=1 Tax=Schistocerca piceifrons TaxID=274613 RepID=UPI001F5F1AB9
MDTPVKLTVTEKENAPGCYEVNRTDLTGSQGGMSPSSRLLLLNAIAGLTGRDRRKYEKKLERAWKQPRILPKGDKTPPNARLIKAKAKKSPKRSKKVTGSPAKKRKTTSRKPVAARRQEVADAAGSAAPEPTAPANTKADRATCSGGQQGQVAAEQSASAATASARPEAPARPRAGVNAQKHEGAEAGARGRQNVTDAVGAGSPPRENARAEEPRSVDEACAEGSERSGSSAGTATQEIDEEGFQLARKTARQSPALVTPTPIHTANRFDVMGEPAGESQQAEDSEEIEQQQSLRIPPIVVQFENYKALYDVITNTVGESRFTAKITGGDKVKITTKKNVDDYKAVRKVLEERKFHFYTFPLAARRPIRLVFRGVPHTTDTADIKKFLLEEGFE